MVWEIIAGLAGFVLGLFVGYTCFFNVADVILSRSGSRLAAFGWASATLISFVGGGTVTGVIDREDLLPIYLLVGLITAAIEGLLSTIIFLFAWVRKVIREY